MNSSGMLYFDGALFLTVFAALFAMMNPLANTPVFLGLSEGMPKKEVSSLAIRSVLLAFAIGVVFVLLGNQILSLFGISIMAFKIAGGVLVALVGYHLLNGQQSPVQKPSDAHLDRAEEEKAVLSLAVSPLAMPILAGPGTLVTLMNYTAGKPLGADVTVIVAYAVISILTLISFLAGSAVTQFMGTNALMVVSRIMGLILTVVGVQMLIEGIKGAFSLT